MSEQGLVAGLEWLLKKQDNKILIRHTWDHIFTSTTIRAARYHPALTLMSLKVTLSH